MNVDDTHEQGPEQEPTTEQQPTQPTEPQPEPQPEQRRLFRSRTDRVIAGVCGGIAKYFGIDPVIVRIIAVVTVFFGGAGILAYIAALLLVPEEGGEAIVGSRSLRGRFLTVVGIVLLVAAAGALLPWGWHWYFGGFLVPLAIVAALGFALWSYTRGDRTAGDGAARPRDGADIARRLLVGTALLIACGFLALGAGWAAAVGEDVVVAGLVILAGGMLAAGAFVRPVRWLIGPALALALPLAVVSAANIEVDNSVGERVYRPATVSEVRDRYELGMGHLEVDLRGTNMPAGDRRIEMKVGVGEAELIVPEDVCVSSAAKIGVGAVLAFDQDNGGIDVDWEDLRRAPSDVTRIVLDAHVGIGAVRVAHTHGDGFDGPGRRFRDRDGRAGNFACEGGISADASGGHA